MQRAFIFLIVSFFLASCASGYEKFYRPLPIRQIAGLVPLAGDPQYSTSNSDPQTIIANMYEDSYAPVGVAAFVGPAGNPSDALDQARKVGAARVIITSKFRNTVSGSIPLTLPNTTTSFNSGTANVYGSGGFATGNYSGTTTTYGTQTTYIPYSVDRYDQVAIFFAQLNRRGFGTLVNELTPDQKQQLGTNKAVAVVAVRRGSPAFMADIMPGDFLISVNGVETFDVDATMSAMNASMGKTSSVSLIRNGHAITKTVAVPNGEW